MSEERGRGPLDHQAAVELLHDYLDGALDEGSRREVDAHIESCVACREELAALRALADAAAALPRAIEPPRDLWPAIDARLEDRRTRREVRISRPALAAAAVLLVAVSSTLTVLLIDRRSPEPAPAPRSTETAMPSSSAVRWSLVEREYEGAAAELRETLAALEGELSPETRRIVEENLALIDRAIEEARAALARDPSNRELAELLDSTYRQKLDVLRQVVRL